MPKKEESKPLDAQYEDAQIAAADAANPQSKKPLSVQEASKKKECETEQNSKDTNMPAQPVAEQPKPVQGPPVMYQPLAQAPQAYSSPGVLPYYGSPYMAKPKVQPKFDRNDRLFALFALIAGFLFLRFMVWNTFGYFSTATAVALLAMCISYLKVKGYHFQAEHYICAGVIVVFSALFSITADKEICFYALCLICVLTAYLVFSVCSGRRFSERFPRDQFNALIYPFNGMSYPFRALFAKQNEKKSRNVLYVLIGLVISLPIFLIVLTLLMRADQAMERAMASITFDRDRIMPIIVQILFGIPVAMYLFGMLFINASKRRAEEYTDEAYAKQATSGRVLPNALIYGAVTPLLVLYGIFFFTQLPYFTAGFSGVVPHGYNFAKYAVRGFNELLALAVINLVVVVIMQRCAKNSGEQKTLVLRIYSVLLSLATLILVVSSFSKLAMYIQKFGLTRRRVLSAWMIALIGIVFLLVLLAQFIKKLPLIRTIVVVGILMFGVLAFARVDRQIAKFNIRAFQNGTHMELDGAYLAYYLSDDAVLYIFEEDALGTVATSMHMSEQELRKSICTDRYLSYRYDADPYQRYNLAFARVQKYLDD